MFYRQAFVTNSSSTSFIFFGVRIAEIDDSIINKILPPEKINRLAYERINDEIYQWAENLEGPIGVYIDWEMQDGVVYIKDSYQYLEGRFDEVPIGMLLESGGKKEEWAEQVLAFCKEYGLTPIDYRDKEPIPRWRVALEVNR